MPQSNIGYLESQWRNVLTVNSTSSTALSTLTDLAPIAYSSTTLASLAALPTVAASCGRIVDLGASRQMPLKKNNPTDINRPTIPGAYTGDLDQGSISLPTRMVFQPYGTAASARTFVMQVFGIYPASYTDADAPIYWVFSPLIEFIVTTGAFGGGVAASAGLPAASTYWASDIAVTATSDNVGYTLMDGAHFAAYPCPGQIAILTNGARFVYVRFSLAGGGGTGAASANSLYRTT